MRNESVERENERDKLHDVIEQYKRDIKNMIQENKQLKNEKDRVVVKIEHLEQKNASLAEFIDLRKKMIFRSYDQR